MCQQKFAQELLKQLTLDTPFSNNLKPSLTSNQSWNTPVKASLFGLTFLDINYSYT